jgi:hypothetical protein
MGDIMSPQIASSNNLNSNYQNEDKFKTDIGIVYDVVLDETGGNGDIETIGAVKFRFNNDTITPNNSLQYALPYDKNFVTLPVKNEQVHIIKNGLGYYYQRIQPDQTPNNSAFINQISFKFENTKNSNISETNNIENYRKVEIHKTPISNKKVSNDYDKLGKYFTYTNGIHKIKLYEGDTTIQSRFGQSLRFSAYNNNKNTFSPTIILRNSEAPTNQTKQFNVTVEEDINKDGSVLVMASNQYQLPFASTNTTKPDSFTDYPDKLNGDQILLNSGRLIFSAKSGEIIFHSKKNYGFISDGGLSIDNKGGVDISVNDNINIDTNGRDVLFKTGNGSIFLGDNNLEPLVKGNELKKIFEELIIAILSQTFKTPSGPTAVGPENFNDFIAISDKLANMMSKTNQTS